MTSVASASLGADREPGQSRTKIKNVAAMRLLAEEKRILSLECQLIEAELKSRRIDGIMSELSQHLAEEEKTAEQRNLLNLEIAFIESQIAKKKVEMNMKKASQQLPAERIEDIVEDVYSQPPPVPERVVQAPIGKKTTKSEASSTKAPQVSRKLASILNRFEQVIKENEDYKKSAWAKNNALSKYQHITATPAAVPLRQRTATKKTPIVHHIAPASSSKATIPRAISLRKAPVVSTTKPSQSASSTAKAPFNVTLRKTRPDQAEPKQVSHSNTGDFDSKADEPRVSKSLPGDEKEAKEMKVASAVPMTAKEPVQSTDKQADLLTTPVPETQSSPQSTTQTTETTSTTSIPVSITPPIISKSQPSNFMGYSEVPLLISAGPMDYVEIPILLSAVPDPNGSYQPPFHARKDTDETVMSTDNEHFHAKETAPSQVPSHRLEANSSFDEYTVYDEETVVSYTYSVVNRMRKNHQNDDIDSLKSELHSLKNELSSLRQQDLAAEMEDFCEDDELSAYAAMPTNLIIQATEGRVNHLLGSSRSLQKHKVAGTHALHNSNSTINSDTEIFFEEVLESSRGGDATNPILEAVSGPTLVSRRAIQNEMEDSSCDDDDDESGSFVNSDSEEEGNFEMQMDNSEEDDDSSFSLTIHGESDPSSIGSIDPYEAMESVTKPGQSLEQDAPTRRLPARMASMMNAAERREFLVDDEEASVEEEIVEYYEEETQYEEFTERTVEEEESNDQIAPQRSLLQPENYQAGDDSMDMLIYQDDHESIDYGYEDHQQPRSHYEDSDGESAALAMLMKGKIKGSVGHKSTEQSSESSYQETEDEFWGSREFVNMNSDSLSESEDVISLLQQSTQQSEATPTPNDLGARRRRNKKDTFSNNSRRGGRRCDRGDNDASSVDDEQTEHERREIFRLAHKEKGYAGIVQEAASLGRLTRLHEHVVEASGRKSTTKRSGRRASVVATNLLDIQWNTTHHGSVCTELEEIGAVFRGKEVITESYHPSGHSGWDNRTFSDSDDYDEFGGETDSEDEGPMIIESVVKRVKEEDREKNRRILEHLQSQNPNEIELPEASVPQVHSMIRKEQRNPRALRRGSIGTVTRTLGQDVIQRHSERQSRIDAGHVHMRGQCNCPYCYTASPFQTYAYKKEMERQEGAPPPGTWTRKNGKWSRTVTRHHVRDRLAQFSHS